MKYLNALKEKKEMNRTSDVDFVPRMGNYMVTPEMAQEWLDLFQYEHQRKIRPYHATALANEIREGRFREYTQIAFCQGLFDGWYYLTNGYHTLSAIVRSQQPVLLSVIVKPVNSIQEVAADYTRHDSGLSRTITDALAVYELAKKFGITKTNLKFIANGSLYYEFLKGYISRDSLEKLTIDGKRLIIEKNGFLAIKAFSFFDGANIAKQHYLRRRSTVAPAMLCAEAQPEKAKEFWHYLALDDGLKKNDPRKALLTFFQDTMCVGGSFGARKKAVTDDVFVKSIAAAWNAFYENRTLTRIAPKHEVREVFFKGVGTFRL